MIPSQVSSIAISEVHIKLRVGVRFSCAQRRLDVPTVALNRRRSKSGRWSKENPDLFRFLKNIEVQSQVFKNLF